MRGPLERKLQHFRAANRGQLITLEAITGAVILLLIVLFTLQATVITPLSASTANQQVEEQNKALANDLLETSAEHDILTEAVLNWNQSKDPAGFENTEKYPYYTDGGPVDTEFGTFVNETFKEENVAFNIYVQYDNDGELNETRMVYQGAPSYNAATATKTLFIYDTEADAAFGSPPENYIQDTAEDSELYNVVRVKIVVWRM